MKLPSSKTLPSPSGIRNVLKYSRLTCSIGTSGRRSVTELGSPSTASAAPRTYFVSGKEVVSAAEWTPGNSTILWRTRSKNAALCSPCAYLLSGSAVLTVSKFVASNPGSTFDSNTKLRISSPEAARSANANINSHVTSAARTLHSPSPRNTHSRAPFKSMLTSGLQARNAGNVPNSAAVKSVIPKAKSSTHLSNAISPTCTKLAGA